jgi:hypothetical protein
LRVENSDVSDASLEYGSSVQVLPAVTTCRLVALDQFSGVYFFFLTYLPNLETLSLYIQDINAPLEAISRCPPSLKHLRLRCGTHMNFFAGLGRLLKVLTARCGRLETLTLSNLSFAKFYKQQWVLPPSVHTLHLVGCEEVGLSWMRLLSPRMPGLKTFHVSVCSPLSFFSNTDSWRHRSLTRTTRPKAGSRASGKRCSCLQSKAWPSSWI